MFKTLKKNISITNIMDFGQQRLQQQQNARDMMYQNSGYQFERMSKKTLIVDIADDGSSFNPLSKAENFSVKLFEPLIVDKLSDIYLDSFMTHNCQICHTGDKMAFSLGINEFNINSNSASNSSTAKQHTFNRIIIPNEHSSISNVHTCVVHKGKKLNYVCSINPCKLSNITGKITDLNGASMYNDCTPGNAADGGILHYVQLTSGVIKHVDKGVNFGWSGSDADTGGDKFSVAFAMEEGDTNLYFYSNGGTVTETSSPALGNVSSSDTGIDSLTSNVSTYRVGDFPRFIAEFVIIARE